MRPNRFNRRSALFTLGALATLAALSPRARAAAPGLPGDSVYRMPATLTDAEGRSLEFASLQGSPVIASMFYTSCTMVCPMIFETVHATLRALPAAERDAVRVLLVSFDPERDSPAALKKAAQDRSCDSRWLLARCDAATTRKLAAVLGIQYRRLADGEFNHSTTLDLLDRQGRITARSGKLGAADPALVAALHKACAA
jgi:protein SCO1/2